MTNGIFMLMSRMKQCMDRGCSCNKKKTKKILQVEYEEINSGLEFLLEYRYSAILTTVFTIMMYSSGLPLLYFLGFLTFFFMYWVDKFLSKILNSLILVVLKFYRNPP